jgi:hypothetical protein
MSNRHDANNHANSGANRHHSLDQQLCRWLLLSKAARQLSAATRALKRDRAPAGEIAARWSKHPGHEIDVAFAPDTIEAKAAEDYSLATGAWIGATLDQGVLYRMSAALIMPGIDNILLPKDLEFA